MNTKIIAAISIVVILSVAIFAYVHFASSSATDPPTPSPTSSPVQTLNATISISPTSLELQTAKVGQTVELSLTVNNVKDLWGWDFSDLIFNASVLNLTQVQEGSFLEKGGQTFFLSTMGVPQVSQGDLPSVADALTTNTTASGSGTLATLKFTVLSAGTSNITLTSARLFNPYVANATAYVEGLHEEINSTIINGNVTVANITP